MQKKKKKGGGEEAKDLYSSGHIMVLQDCSETAISLTIPLSSTIDHGWFSYTHYKQTHTPILRHCRMATKISLYMHE